MTDRQLQPTQLAALAEVRANIADLPNAADFKENGRSVADALRKEYPELSDALLGHLMANVCSYAAKFSRENPDEPPIAVAVVFAAAAIDLTSLEIPGDTQP